MGCCLGGNSILGLEQWVKDLVLLQLWHRLQLQLRFSVLDPETSICYRCGKKNKTKQNKTKHRVIGVIQRNRHLFIQHVFKIPSVHWSLCETSIEEKKGQHTMMVQRQTKHYFFGKRDINV